MIKFLKSLFSKRGQGTSSGYKIEPIHNWPPPPPIISGTNSYSYGSENDRIQILYDALTSDYWLAPKKKLPKRDSKGRFSK